MPKHRLIAFHPAGTPDSDYGRIRTNGMWYQEWQGGYHDILKRGYPRPKHKTTILAELHSPITPDFLHGGAVDVPFLVSSRVKQIIRQEKLTGIRFSRVEIAKVATKGKRHRQQTRGEPEDQILKAKDQASAVAPPSLHAVYVTGRFDIVPEFPSGRCPDSYVTPYDLPTSGTMPDLWCPTIQGRTFAAWFYCSQRFRDVITKHAFSNIEFESFEEQMARFRGDLRRYEQEKN